MVAAGPASPPPCELCGHLASHSARVPRHLGTSAGTVRTSRVPPVLSSVREPHGLGEASVTAEALLSLSLKTAGSVLFSSAPRPPESRGW